ncbi:arsenic transporter [Paenibacillus humicus]|uniref:arsenic transporter n=1 Tax=Paenibacillus humicus TaxID=412861 RepID=UPI000FDA9CC2|nr:arsenic transporter [Paenibacillus humicus]
MAITAAILFAITLLFVIWQPKGLGIGWPAAGGAIAALLFQVVTLEDVAAVTGIVWNATLAFVAIILISLALDEIGFFEWSALHMARLAGGSSLLMFIYMILLGAAVSALFANDGAALIMTPIVLAVVRALRFDDRMVLPFVMASGFIADTASLPLVVSNLVNIVSADFFGISFDEYASRMIVPSLFSIAASLLVLYLFYRKSIRGSYTVGELKNPRDAIKDPRLFKLAWIVLAALPITYFASGWLHVPVSIPAGAIALLFLAAVRRSPEVDVRKLVKGAPWSIVIFSIGMYVVVYGLRNAGLMDSLTSLFEAIGRQGLLMTSIAAGFIAAVLSSVMNNLPTVMIDALAIQATKTSGVIREAMIYANVIGSNLGPKITPIGSLATLLWLHVLSRKGLRIGWGYYFKTGIALTVPTLLITLSGLYLWLSFLSLNVIHVWLANAGAVLIFAAFGWLLIARSKSKRKGDIPSYER